MKNDTEVEVILNKGMSPLQIEKVNAFNMLEYYFPRQVKRLLEICVKKAREENKLSMGKHYKTAFAQ